MDAWKATEGLECVEVQDEAALREALEDAELIVDAVVGTGFKPPLRGLAAAARDLIAEMQDAGGRGGSAERVGCGFHRADVGG